MGSPPGPVAGGAPVARFPLAYVTPSRLATRTTLAPRRRTRPARVLATLKRLTGPRAWHYTYGGLVSCLCLVSRLCVFDVCVLFLII